MQKVLSTIFSKKIKKFSTFFELFFIANRHITVCLFFSPKSVQKDTVFSIVYYKIKKRLLTFNNLFQSHLTFFAVFILNIFFTPPPIQHLHSVDTFLQMLHCQGINLLSLLQYIRHPNLFLSALQGHFDHHYSILNSLQILLQI